MAASMILFRGLSGCAASVAALRLWLRFACGSPPHRDERVPNPLRAPLFLDLISASGTGCSSRWLVFG